MLENRPFSITKISILISVITWFALMVYYAALQVDNKFLLAILLPAIHLEFMDRITTIEIQIGGETIMDHEAFHGILNLFIGVGVWGFTGYFIGFVVQFIHHKKLKSQTNENP